MNNQETTKILMTISAIYPNFKIENEAVAIKAWGMKLAQYSYKEVETALMMFNGHGFPPSVDNIIDLIHKPEQLAQDNEGQAWNEVRKAIGRGNYYSEEDFEKLDPISKRVVGSPAQIRIWAADPDFNEGVESSNFKRIYKNEQKKAQEISMMPPEIRERLNTILEGKNENTGRIEERP